MRPGNHLFIMERDEDGLRRTVERGVGRVDVAEFEDGDVAAEEHLVDVICDSVCMVFPKELFDLRAPVLTQSG